MTKIPITIAVSLLTLGNLRADAGSSPGKLAPEPDPISTKPWLIGTLHCPLWGSPERWDPIRKFPDREPLLGFYEEGNPDVTDWEIKWSLDHGISFFLVCWYRAKNNYGLPVRPEFDHWIKSLPEARYGKMTRYAIMYENGNRNFDGRTSREDWERNLVPFWIANYFTQSNYLVIDNKPLVGVYNVPRLVEDLGGIEGAKEAFEFAREECRKAGFDGLYIIGQYCWGAPRALEKIAATIEMTGIDASWAYHWPTFARVLGDELRPSSQQVIEAQEQLWHAQQQPNILTLSMGWDSEPWRFSSTRVQWRLTPEEFEELSVRAKRVMEQRTGNDLASRMLLIDCWNEFGEGHYVLPTREHGFGYLEAIKKVFANGENERPDAAPGISDAPNRNAE